MAKPHETSLRLLILRVFLGCWHDGWGTLSPERESPDRLMELRLGHDSGQEKEVATQEAERWTLASFLSWAGRDGR